MSVQRGLRDGRQLQEGENTYLCNGQSSCRAVFSVSLFTAALHLRAGSSMFARIGSQGNNAERKVPVIGALWNLAERQQVGVC